MSVLTLFLLLLVIGIIIQIVRKTIGKRQRGSRAVLMIIGIFLIVIGAYGVLTFFL